MIREFKTRAKRRNRAASPPRGPGIPAFCLLFCLLALCLPASAARAGASAAGPAASLQTEKLRKGERIFRDGILPSGKPLQAMVKGDLAVDGRMFSCVNCHRRSGLGSTEGSIVTPANAGSKLFQPSYYGRDFTPSERSALPEHYRAPLRRPAYTEQTLAQAIRKGVDPAGRALHPVMPRYELNDSDMAILISYLKALSAEPSPGVSDSTIRFATVVSSGVPARDSAAMLATLEAFVAEWNSRAKVHAERARYPEIAQEADLSYRTIALSRWHLDGAPASWRSQLEAHYGKDPVFALLGGISSGEWKSVHDFCEERRIPCLFPITDLPLISGSDWYTLYLSKGLYQEGEAAAASLGRVPELAEKDTVLQLFRDTGEGRALAAGFETAWRSLGRRPPVNRMLRADEPITQDAIRRLAGKEMPSALLLWLGKEGVPVLAAISESERRPKEVYLSASLLGEGLWSLPEPAREFTSITYPYRLPQDETMHPNYAKAWLRARQLPVDDGRIATRMYSLMLLMNQAIPRMGRNFYRDNLLDQIDLSLLHGYPDYERLSFGPGQRYASKECHIVTLSRGPDPILLRKSD